MPYVEPTILSYAFAAGMLATINPCGFAMLPAYVSYYLAADGAQAALAECGSRIVEGPGSLVAVARRLGRALIIGATVASGFVLLFGAGGGVIAAGAYLLADLMPLLGLLVGVGLVLMGLWLLAGKHIRGLRLPLPRLKSERGLRAMFVFGLAYGLASLSCALPVFLVAVGGAFSQEGLGAAMLGFGAYAAGMTLVLMAITLGLAFFQSAVVTHLRRAMPVVERLSALLITGAGGYIVYYWLSSGLIPGFGS